LGKLLTFKKLLILKTLLYKTVIFILFVSSIHGQNPNILWQNTINANGFDTISTSLPVSTGGTLLVATSDSDSSGDKTENSNGGNDIWLIKINDTGTIEWQETIGGSLLDFINSAKETPDGGFILGGGSRSGISGDKTEENVGGNDLWILKINAVGVIEWQTTIGGTSSDSVRAINLTNDNGYIVSASSQSGISGDKTEIGNGGIDIWLLKIDSLGAILWQNTIGSNNDDIPTAVDQTADGGYILGNYSNSGISGDKSEPVNGFQDFWVIKTDANGTIEWENTIGGNNGDVLRDLKILNTGNYLVLGYSDSDISLDKTENSRGTFDYWIMELNTNGDIVWQKTIGGDDEDFAFNLEITADGNYLIAGQSKSDSSGEKTDDSKGGIDFWPMKIDPSGGIIWQETIGGNSNDNLVNAFEISDGYIICGHSFSDISDDKTENSSFIDPWIVKLDLEPTASIPENLFNKIKVFPNPSQTEISVNSEQTMSIVLYDVLGKKVAESSTSTLTITTLPSGLYIAKLYNDNAELISINKIIKD
jgi:hypothetical protein